VAQLLITSHSIIADASRLAEEAHIEATEAQRVASNLTVILMIVLAIAITTYCYNNFVAHYCQKYFKTTG